MNLFKKIKNVAKGYAKVASYPAKGIRGVTKELEKGSKKKGRK